MQIHELAQTITGEGELAIDNGTTTERIEIGKLPLDTAAASGTDKEMYDSLVALGWTDCIE